MASTESLFVTSLVLLVVGVGEISNDWAKDVAGGGRDSWYGSEMTRLTLKLLISSSPLCSTTCQELLFFRSLRL